MRLKMQNRIDPRWHNAEIILSLPFGIVQDIKNPNHFLIRSKQDLYLVYNVTFSPVYDLNGKVEKYRGSCNCIDYMYGSRSDIEFRCSHILVYFLAKDRGKIIKRVNVESWMNPT